MTSTPPPVDHPADHPRSETWLALAAAAELLAIASRQVGDQAEEATDPLAASSLSLAIRLLQGRACQLVVVGELAGDHHPAAYPAVDGEGDGGDPPVVRLDELTGLGVLVDLYERPLVSAPRLLQEAEMLLRRLPVGRADLVEVPGLVIELCDLLREARTLET